jgi:hypothetical protein
MTQMLGMFPELLGVPVENLGPRVDFLLETVGVSKAELRKVQYWLPSPYAFE